MFDQVGFAAADFTRLRDFYEKALAPLGYRIVVEASPEETGGDASAGFGSGETPQFWIGPGVPVNGMLRIAFTASDRAAVEAFHHAAVAAGGTDHGAPTLCAFRHPNYYAAMVLDPEGHVVEAVCHKPA
jgi:catechol 2,3-dioxygenase-like lactoylglutathione lyase family enzyme